MTIFPLCATHIITDTWQYFPCVHHIPIIITDTRLYFPLVQHILSLLHDYLSPVCNNTTFSTDMTLFPLCAAHPQSAAAAPGHGGRWSPVPAGDPALQTSDVRRGAPGVRAHPGHHPVSHLLLQRELSGMHFVPYFILFCMSLVFLTYYVTMRAPKTCLLSNIWQV